MKLTTGILYRTVSARTGSLRTALKPPDPIRLLLAWTVAGVLLGAVLCRRMPQLADSPLLTQGLAVSAETRSLWTVCKTALCPMLLLLGGIWASGCAAFGQILSAGLLLSRGIAFGISAAVCFMQFPMRDAAVIAAVLILPYGFFSALVLCYAVRDAMRMSGRMTGCLLHGTAEAEVCGTDRLSNMLCCLLLTLAAAGMQTMLLWLLNDPMLAA